MQNKTRIIYLVLKALFSLMILMGVQMYFFKTEMVQGFFEALGYPIYLIYPLGIAKILGIIALWAPVPHTLKEFAFGGFFFNLLLAFSAHMNVQDGEFMALILLVVAIVVYILDRKVYPREF